jgi:uncharacterized membrane protein YgdD (TMEM256/DUF423 family)
MPSAVFWWRFGCLSAASAVGLGAFGAHALKNSGVDQYYLKIWETATLYQFIHALGIIFISQRNALRSSNTLDWAAIAFSSGTALFSGSLYLLTLTQKKWLGAITPLGGTLFILGWLMAAFAE